MTPESMQFGSERRAFNSPDTRGPTPAVIPANAGIHVAFDDWWL
jgi:hypothetical protein